MCSARVNGNKGGLGWTLIKKTYQKEFGIASYKKRAWGQGKWQGFLVLLVGDGKKKRTKNALVGLTEQQDRFLRPDRGRGNSYVY